MGESTKNEFYSSLVWETVRFITIIRIQLMVNSNQNKWKSRIISLFLSVINKVVCLIVESANIEYELAKNNQASHQHTERVISLKLLSKESARL